MMTTTPGSAGWLALLCASRVLSAAWFVAYSAVLPLVREDWGLSARDAGMIQGASTSATWPPSSSSVSSPTTSARSAPSS